MDTKVKPIGIISNERALYKTIELEPVLYVYMYRAHHASKCCCCVLFFLLFIYALQDLHTQKRKEKGTQTAINAFVVVFLEFLILMDMDGIEVTE